MKMNLTKMSLLSVVMMTTVTILSSNNILFSWMMLEMNMISFMPILTKSKKMNEQSMKYFIIQSSSSSIMLMSILMNSMIEYPLNLSIMLISSMLMKIGMMPFHTWLIPLMQSMTWENCIIMSTWQKISPTILMTQMINMKQMIIPMCISLMIAPMSAMNQSSLKKIMAYSSISNSPWMISSLMYSKQQFMMFMMIYSTLTLMTMKKMKEHKLMFINQISMEKDKPKLSMMILMLSISGMPPLVGFTPKWLILQSNLLYSVTLSISMILSSMISTFVYMKMMSNFMMNSSTKKKTKKSKMKKDNSIIFNILGLPMMMMVLSVG
uniref:NADH dehydrogenase subunit 2 n=1 Tax=Paravarcia deceptrix TaxID=1200249 RepID=UPI002A80CF37|nr:NADH dehydrogenase subunit 2 [Paravarcia deceptrix]WOW99100.1 NADH dehydrogenase subunit 2 [Paravarcia deceptrix]